jgi:hypothetical protein
MPGDQKGDHHITAFSPEIHPCNDLTPSGFANKYSKRAFSGGSQIAMISSPLARVDGLGELSSFC